MVKPMVAVQYWDGGLNVDSGDKHFKNDGGLTKGYGVVVGATAPLFGGSFKATVGYNDYEDLDDVKNFDGNNLMLGAAYEYPLSKRTSVYTAAGYSQIEKDMVGGDKDKTKTQEVMFGMIHKF